MRCGDLLTDPDDDFKARWLSDSDSFVAHHLRHHHIHQISSLVTILHHINPVYLSGFLHHDPCHYRGLLRSTPNRHRPAALRVSEEPIPDAPRSAHFQR
jgi:hypothetical protein